MALHCEEDCGSWRVYSDDGDFDANCDDEAMARTVTASFDMLEALEALRDAGTVLETKLAVDKADAAIDKAKGE